MQSEEGRTGAPVAVSIEAGCDLSSCALPKFESEDCEDVNGSLIPKLRHLALPHLCGKGDGERFARDVSPAWASSDDSGDQRQSAVRSWSRSRGGAKRVGLTATSCGPSPRDDSSPLEPTEMEVKVLRLARACAAAARGGDGGDGDSAAHRPGDSSPPVALEARDLFRPDHWRTPRSGRGLPRPRIEYDADDADDEHEDHDSAQVDDGRRSRGSPTSPSTLRPCTPRTQPRDSRTKRKRADHPDPLASEPRAQPLRPSRATFWRSEDADSAFREAATRRASVRKARRTLEQELSGALREAKPGTVHRLTVSDDESTSDDEDDPHAEFVRSLWRL